MKMDHLSTPATLRLEAEDAQGLTRLVLDVRSGKVPLPADCPVIMSAPSKPDKYGESVPELAEY